jgi:hypothetical protein
LLPESKAYGGTIILKYKGETMMIEVISVGERGVSRSLNKLQELITRNIDALELVAKIDDHKSNYSFMAIFHDRCTVGKYSACIQEWGSNDGKSGVGGSYFVSMNKFLDENNLPIKSISLFDHDVKAIGYETREALGSEDRMKIWAKYAQHLLS